MNYKGAVFFDYDGTLTDVAAGIPVTTQATRRAMAQLRANGYLAMLCSGRAVSYGSESGAEFDGMVTSNGTYVTVNGEEILNCPVEAETMRRFTARLDAMGIAYGIDNPVKCLTPDIQAPDFLKWLETYSIPAKAFRQIEPNETPVGYKFSVLYHNDEEIRALHEEFGELVFACQRTSNCADVTVRGFDKSVGVKAVIEHFHLPVENTYAFGDGENDLSMFRAVGHGVAMGDHAAVLEPYAAFVTRCVCDEGIEYGLKHFGLI